MTLKVKIRSRTNYEERKLGLEAQPEDETNSVGEVRDHQVKNCPLSREMWTTHQRTGDSPGLAPNTAIELQTNDHNLATSLLKLWNKQ